MMRNEHASTVHAWQKGTKSAIQVVPKLMVKVKCIKKDKKCHDWVILSPKHLASLCKAFLLKQTNKEHNGYM